MTRDQMNVLLESRLLSSLPMKNCIVQHAAAVLTQNILCTDEDAHGSILEDVDDLFSAALNCLVNRTVWKRLGMEGSECCLLPKALVHKESKLIEGADGTCDIGTRLRPLLHDEFVLGALTAKRGLYLIVVSNPEIHLRPVAHDVGMKGPSVKH
eukprot:358661-Chlamydomonas_euryale.AAC.3